MAYHLQKSKSFEVAGAVWARVLVILAQHHFTLYQPCVLLGVENKKEENEQNIVQNFEKELWVNSPMQDREFLTCTLKAREGINQFSRDYKVIFIL